MGSDMALLGRSASWKIASGKSDLKLAIAVFIDGSGPKPTTCFAAFWTLDQKSEN